MATEMAYLTAPLSSGERLKRARDHAGLRQPQVKAALADRGVEVSISDISRWENDVRRPSAIQWMSLADLYGVRPADLAATQEELDAIAKVKEIASRVKRPGKRSRPETYVQPPIIVAAR